MNITLNGVTVDIEEARKAISEADAKQAEQENLIDGYTREQWQRIIDGKYLCEFWDTERFVSPIFSLLGSVIKKPLPFVRNQGMPYKHCRPAQLYGTRHPCFGKRPEWLKDDDRIIWVKYDDGSHTTSDFFNAKKMLFEDVIEFIAMPSNG